MEDLLKFNPGVVVLTPFKEDKPTVVCGNGRSGTSAVMATIIAGGAKCVLSRNSANNESWDFAEALKCKDTLITFVEGVSREYSKEFVVKRPLFEGVRRLPWEGNLIGVFRDAVGVLGRELTCEPRIPGDIDKVLSRQLNSAIHLKERSLNCGVALISYEKLLTAPEECLAALAEWAGFDLNVDKALTAIEPNNALYREAQLQGLRKMGRVKSDKFESSPMGEDDDDIQK